MWTEELKQFNLAYKQKEDNIKKILESEKFDKHLVLVVNKKANNKSYYTLPLDYHKAGETLRQVIVNC